jgi:hypothetical protein
VSALIEHGLAEATVDALVKGDIGTVEKLGSMTPEQLEALEGIDGDAVNRIQQAINSFYGQEYEAAVPAEYAEPVESGEIQVADEVQAEGEFPAEEPALDAAGPGAGFTGSISQDPESQASDTMVESSESGSKSANDAGEEAHSGPESVADEVPEP